MADQDATAEEEEGEEIPKKSKKMLFIIIGVVVLLIAGGVGGFLMMSGGTDDMEEGVKESTVEAKPTYFYELPQITVNLVSDTSEDIFLKLIVSLEVADESVAQAIEPRMPRLLDAFQVYLRELRKSDLEGSAGIYRLKEELRRRVNLAVYPMQIEGVLFKQILVQ